MKNLMMSVLLVVLGSSVGAVAEEKSNDDGYFLTFSQKCELISRGEITDSKKNVYDVWLCPGYVYPSEFARDEGWKKGTEAFGEYFEAKKYRDLADDSGDCLEFAWEDCIQEGLIEGVPLAWDKSFSQAAKQVEKRVFGWFMAYPTAFFMSLADNIFRIPITITGCVMGNTAGLAIVPTYYAMNSGIEGTSRYLVPGTLVPLSGYTFNTLISPPLSLLGQRPDESRVDGFWVTMTSAEKAAATKLQSIPLTDEELSAYAKWAETLRTELKPFDLKTEELKSDYQVKYRKMQKEIQTLSNRHQRTINKVDKEKQQAYAKLMENQVVGNTKINPYRIKAQEVTFRNYLSKKGMMQEDINEIIKTINNQKHRHSENHYRHRMDKSLKKYKKADPSVEAMKKPDQIMREIE